MNNPKNRALTLADEMNRATAQADEFVNSTDGELLLNFVRQFDDGLASDVESVFDEAVELNEKIVQLCQDIENAGAKRQVSA